MYNMSGYVSVYFMWFIVLSSLFSFVCGDDLLRKFEYQFSFKGPQLTIDNQIPFWSYGESALPSEDQIRLVPSIRSKKGFVWSQFAFGSKDFEIEVMFKITGRGRVGADGMALWFTDAPGFEGNVYGNRDMWNGLGIFLDSYDNDGKGNNPYISIVANDGTKSYDHSADGGDQVLAGCQYDFRNKPYPSRLKFQYHNDKISLWYSAGITQEPEYELCLTHTYSNMPSSKFLGLSAATGGLADDHDVLSFLTFTLSDAPTEGQKIADAEKKRLAEEFEKFSESMEERKRSYREENPNKFAKEEDPDFEDLQERQLRLIFDGQHRLFRALNEMKLKLDGVGPSGAAAGGVSSDDMRRLQKDLGSITNTINHVYTVANEQKTILREIQNRVIQIQTGKTSTVAQNVQAAAGVPAPAVDPMVKGDISSMKQDLVAIKQSLFKIPTECPKVTPQLSRAPNAESESVNCVGNSTFVIFAILQIVLMSVYIYFQRQKEQSAKKFF